MNTPSRDGLIYAYLIESNGEATAIGWNEVSAWTRANGILWLHFDYTQPKTRDWIKHQSGLDDISADALLAEETRPRCIAQNDTLLLTLRGVNLNPGADPEDMVSLRVWAEEHRIITSRKRRLVSVETLQSELKTGRGPRDVSGFLVSLCDKLVDRMAEVVGELDDRIGELEEQVLVSESHGFRPKLAQVRREVIGLRRYMAPQREALARLQVEQLSWMKNADRLLLREINDGLIRCIENLDAARERAAVSQEELTSRLSEQMDKRMYVLSIVAAVFLPLGFLTGLLGVNVGGIPGANSNVAFYLFIVLLAGIVGVQIWILRRKHWM